MAPDPSIIRVEDDFYIATSTFHWNPGIALYHSKDLANWEMIDFALKNDEVHLEGTNTPAGIWAPHLSYDPETKRYWIIYSHMVNMAGREFSADNFAIWSYDIHGPWSSPMYITSIGFDPSLFHDADGKHYICILEWETRDGYQAPGTIVIAEIDLETGKIKDKWTRVTHGFTTRGNAEAPQIYKKGDYYYLVIAAGGTGYGHGVEVGRATSIFGPYEPHPSGQPILTSSPRPLFSLGNPDAGHFEMYNPNSPMQKSGHGSLVETQNGEWYMAHLMSRPLEGALLNPLGRETALQKMKWTEDNWLEMEDGSNFAKISVPSPKGLEAEQNSPADFSTEFEGELPIEFMTPYHTQNGWVNLSERSGFLRIYGRDSLFSKVKPSILATRATSFDYNVETEFEFNPVHYSQTAGVGLYYDSSNWIYANINYNELLQTPVLRILQAKLGNRIEWHDTQIPLESTTVQVKFDYSYGMVQFFYRLDNKEWNPLTNETDVTYLSDEGVNGEPGEIGGFTGLFNFIGAVDAYQNDSYADFNFYRVYNR